MPWNFVCKDLHSSPYHLVIVPSNRLRSNCKLYTHSFCVWQGGSRYFCVRWGLPHWLARPRWPPWNLQQRPGPHRGGAASPRIVRKPPRPGHATSPHRGANWKPRKYRKIKLCLQATEYNAKNKNSEIDWIHFYLDWAISSPRLVLPVYFLFPFTLRETRLDGTVKLHVFSHCHTVKHNRREELEV